MSIIVISVENYAGAGDNIENCAYFAKIGSYDPKYHVKISLTYIYLLLQFSFISLLVTSLLTDLSFKFS